MRRGPPAVRQTSQPPTPPRRPARQTACDPTRDTPPPPQIEDTVCPPPGPVSGPALRPAACRHDLPAPPGAEAGGGLRLRCKLPPRHGAGTPHHRYDIGITAASQPTAILPGSALSCTPSADTDRSGHHPYTAPSVRLPSARFPSAGSARRADQPLH